MEFIKSNFLETTSSITVSTGTLTAKYLFYRDPSFQWVSQNAGTDATTTSLTVSFDRTMTVGRIALLGHNLKQYRIFYNGSTANTFALTTTSNFTTTTNFATNSETCHYFVVTPIECTSVTIDMYSTIVTNSEKAIGYLMLSQSLLTFPVDPPADGYKPVLVPNSVEHKLATGGKRVHKTGDKWNVQLSFKYIESSFVKNLRDVYEDQVSFAFCPFGTATGWTDQILFDCCWSNNFDFYRYSDNAVSAGFSGKVELEET